MGYHLPMPTVLRAEGFEFRIWTNDHEPPHVHVFKDGTQAKVNLLNSEVERVWRMNRRDVRRAEQLVTEHRDVLLEAWRGIHG